MSFNPVNVSVICEGPTEVEFIKILSRKHFSPKGIFLKASSVGGDVSIDKLLWHIKHAPYPVVTTFADYYGFKIKRGTDACQIENALKSKIRLNGLSICPVLILRKGLYTKSAPRCHFL